MTGEPGSGKTFALKTVAGTPNSTLFKVAYVGLSTGTVMDMYRQIAMELGEEPATKRSMD